MPYAFDFERFDMYRLAVEVAHWAAAADWPRGTGPLRDQTVRATQSVVLNIAEGASQRGAVKRNHYRIALGSAGEALAALELSLLDGAAAKQQLLRRIGAMLAKAGR